MGFIIWMEPRTILSNMDLSAFFHIYISGPLKKYLKNYERTTKAAHLCDNNKCTPFAFICNLFQILALLNVISQII
jgi:hypothetical protein